MSEQTRHIANVTVTAVMLIIITLGTLIATGHKWPQAPHQYPTKIPGITYRIP